MGVVARFLNRRMERRLAASPLGQQVAAHEEAFFYSNEHPRLSSLSDRVKREQVEELRSLFVRVLRSSMDRRVFREVLANSVIWHAETGVLCLTESEKSESQIFRNCPYVSGELWRSISKCAVHSPTLMAMIPGGEALQTKALSSMPKQDLMSYANTFSALAAYRINGLNLLRAHMNDIDTSRDWLQPFVESAYIFYEDDYRGKIGLHSLLAGDLDSLVYSSMLQCVLTGVENPLDMWEARNSDDGWQLRLYSVPPAQSR